MARSRGRHFCLMALGAAIVVIAALGIGLGVGLSKHDKKSTSLATAGKSSSSANSTTEAVVTPLPTWDWTSTKQKMYGISMGNWLSLERWMNEDWFTGLAGEDTWDEWNFCLTLGQTAATTALEAHYNTITADNITSIASYGFNHVRIPISFWAFINLTSDEPYVGGIQLAHLDRIAAACYNSGIYILLDLHGLPGSQNGLQQSGHNTSDIEFWTDANQARADATVQAALDYISNSTYRSVFTALAICNEPVTYDTAQINTLTKFYERSYDKFTNMSNPIAMIFHDAYQGRDYWLDFINGKNASMLMIEDHPYPGNFPLQSSSSDILNQVCQKAQGYASYPIPVAVTEFSLTTGIINDAFFKTFYEAQASAFTVSAGAIFWSWQAFKSSDPVLANNTDYMTYSFVDLLAMGVIPTPSANQSTTAMLSTFGNGCSLATQTWASGVVSASPVGSQAVLRKKRHFGSHS